MKKHWGTIDFPLHNACSIFLPLSIIGYDSFKLYSSFSIPQMAEDYASSERLRRSLESERDELQEELNSLGGNRSNLAEEKRRLEARIQQVS